MSIMQKPFYSYDIETTGLQASDKIICIGAVKTNEDGSRDWDTWKIEDPIKDPYNGKHYARSCEVVRLVENFVEFVTQDSEAPIYGFNSSAFDSPKIWQWASIKDDYGDLSRKVESQVLSRHRDIKKVCERNGNYKGLDSILQLHGIEHKSEVSGHMVPQMFRNGEIDRIEQYQREDIRTTHLLVEKLLQENSSSTVSQVSS